MFVTIFLKKYLGNWNQFLGAKWFFPCINSVLCIDIYFCEIFTVTPTYENPDPRQNCL